MPPILAVPILGDLLFMAKGLKLPTQSDWKQPQNAEHYGNSLSIPDKIAIPNYGKGAESLNVAIATSVICAEFRRKK